MLFRSLRQRGQRLLLVQTSGESELEGARAFYAREGYRVVATIPDYYGREIAMVMFCKLL